MRRSGNIFEQENYRGTGVRTMSGTMLALVVCSLLSGLAAFSIICNFGAVTAKIAIFIATLLSSSLPILLVIIAFVYFVMRLKWSIFRSFGRWW